MSIIEKVSEKEGGSYALTFSEHSPIISPNSAPVPSNALGAGLLRLQTSGPGSGPSSRGFMPKFQFGERSLRELEGVHPELVAMVHRALELTEQDFAVHDGLRTREEQQALLLAGASETLDSKHLTGNAVDLVPVVNGKLRWEWVPIFAVAKAVRQAAKELNLKIRWGAAWDVNFTNTLDTPEAVSEAYAARRKAAGKKPFLDGPHFELI